MTPLKFDTLEPRSVPVEIAEERFVLREASAGAGARYWDALTACRLDEAGKVRESYRNGFEGLTDTEAVLVSGCLFRISDKGDEPVTLEWVRSLPSRIVRQLFRWAEKASGFGEREEVSGNGRSATGATSP